MKRCVCILLAAITCLITASAEEPSEEKLIAAALDGAASREDRILACRKLHQAGTARAAESLVPLLADKQLSHMARWVLESLPDPAASKALLDGLGKVKDPALEVGIINSLAVRREPKAVVAVAQRLASENAELRVAAVQALGRIATADAAKALDGMKPDAQPEGLWADALLRCAGQIGTKDTAAICRRLLDTAPSPQKAAALTCLLKLPDADAAELVKALNAEDRFLREAALALVARGPKGANVTEAVAGALAGLKPPVQVQALAVLRERGDKAAVSAARAALKSERAAVRGEAARLLGALGGDEDAAGLIALAAAQDDAGAAARESLATMACARVDELLLGQLSTGDAAAKKQAIGLLAARGCKTLTEKLYDEKLFADADLAQAAAAAIRALGGKDEFARALAFAAKLPADKRGPLVGVLSPLAQRTGDAARCVADVQKAIAALPEGDRVSLIGVLASVPCAESLQALDVLLKETNVEIRKEAVRTLGKWENAQPAELLLNAAKGDADQTVRILAVRSAAFVLGRPKSVARPEDGVALVKRAVDVAERPDEKKAALAALGAFKCKAAVEYAESLKADAVLGSAAGDALRKLQAK